MKPKFAIRQQGASDPIIIMNVYDSRFKGRKFMYSTGISIDGKYCDKKKKTLKRSIPKEIADHLDVLTGAVKNFESKRLNSSSLERSDLKKHLDDSKKDERKEKENQLQKESDFFTEWQRIIDTSKNKAGEPVTKNTLVSKNQTLSLLRRFAMDNKLYPTFETLDMDFYHRLDQYMLDGGLSGNSRGKHVKEIKAVLREAEERDILVNRSFQKKSFKVIRRDTDSTYLNEAELKKILLLKLSPAMERVRDIFVMACFVGARHSDWNQINQSNITTENGRDVIRIKQKKTNTPIHVPVHPVVRFILNKYNGQPPRVISNQKFNKAIQSICKDEKLKLGECTIDGKKVEKHTEVTTHTARRSFATNAYLSRSMDVYQIMRCTGHKTEASFLRYLKLNGKDYASLAAESKFFNNDEAWTMLKIA